MKKIQSAVCITGMHRSGTSMVARMLNLCGLYLGKETELVRPESDNPRGFWENYHFVRINDAILSASGGAWDLPPSDIKGWEKQSDFILLKNKASALVKKFRGHGPWGWKDPRTSLTVPFWADILPDLRFVICLRNPLEVTGSLKKRGYSSDAFGLNLWLTYNQRLMADTMPEQRIITRYESFFVNPQKELRRILDFLEISVSQGSIDQACADITKSLRHHSIEKSALKKKGIPAKILSLYEEMSASIVQVTSDEEKMQTDDSRKIRAIAFYLPQYHPIPENDRWWGKGFTEWTNVTKAAPLFPGHYQPHIPGELGYYDLGSSEARKQQADLAGESGISGFCYYHYWFHGQRLLHLPVDEVLASGEPDFPFCLCWANESWTRAWDGQEKDILIRQEYSEEDDIDHIRFLCKVFNDKRYIRVQGKPLFLVYRANRMPGPLKTTTLWREEARRLGIGELYLCRVESFPDEHTDPRAIGFDAAVEFQPDWTRLPKRLTGPDYRDHAVFPYKNVVGNMLNKMKPAYKRFPCVTPGFDNSPRRNSNAYIFTDSSPDIYELWLKHAIETLREEKGEKILFINAWNEWGEGNHLEPDLRYGRGYLEATQRALSLTKDDEITSLVKKMYEDIQPDIESGRYDQAIHVLEEFLTSHQDLALIHNDLGVLYYQAGSKDKSLLHYEKAVSIDPENITFQKNLADFYCFELNRLEDAVRLYLKALEKKPDDIETLLSLGHVCTILKKDGDAVIFYRKVLAIDPENSLAREKIAVLSFLTKDGEQVSEWMKKDWNNRALEDAAYYVHSTKREQSEEEFDSSGRESVNGLIEQDINLIAGGKDPKTLRALEIGCGLGRMTRHMAGIFGEVYGIDVSGEMIRRAQERLNGITNVFFHETNGKDLSGFQDGSFDFVFSFIVFQHIPSKEVILNYIREAQRVLKPEGIFKFQVQGCTDPGWLKQKKDTWHGETVTFEDIAGISEKIGFEILEHHGQGTQYSWYILRKQGKPADETFKSDREDTDREQKHIPGLVTIVIPVFNKLQYTRECLQTIQKNTLPKLYELIIVDNASTDGTHEFLASMNGTLRVITNTTNQGFTIACNQGAEAARGEYVLFLNNDTEPQAGWLDNMLDLFDTDSRIGIVGSKLVYPDGRLQEAGGIIFSDGSGWNFGRFDDRKKPVYSYTREVDYVSGASLLIRHSLLKQLDYFDEQYSPGYYEDTDLCFGVRGLGYKVMYCPFSLVVHHEGVSSGTDLKQGMKKYQTINKEKFVHKWKNALAQQYKPNRQNVVPASERNAAWRILIIDPFLPLYDRASGGLRLFTIIRMLKELGSHITYIARNGSGQETYAKALRKLGVEVYATDPEKLRKLGISVDAGKIDLESILSSRSYDVALLSFYDIAQQYLDDIRNFSPSTRVIIDTVDIHFVREMRMAETTGNKKQMTKAKKTKENELAIYRRADAVITVTENDWEHIREYLPDKRHFIIPNIHAVDEAPAVLEGRGGLIFIGNFNHPPNADAVKYFIKDIFPLIRQKVPAITLTVVGNNPPKEILGLQNDTVTVTGYVPSTHPYLQSARVSIAPLRFGAGMKGKIGEAMAHGLPVVTTAIGAEGMGLISGETALIGDTPEEFAGHVVQLCSDDNLWHRVAQNGKAFILERFSKETVSERLSEMLKEISLPQAVQSESVPALEQEEMVRGQTSIIILTFNQLKYTKECVESIRKHTPETHEIIFVDNGSKDGTVKWLKQLVRDNAHYRLIENGENLGFAKGCNQGIQASNGQYILLLNNDVVVPEGWLSGMIRCLESSPETGIIGPMTNNISGMQKDIFADYQSVDHLDAYAKGFRERNSHRRIPVRRVVGFCMLFRRDLVDKVGVLDERFGAGNYEDDDFCLRAALGGYKNYIAGDVFIHHYGNRSFTGNRIDYHDAMAKNKKVFSKIWNGIDAGSPLGKKLIALKAAEKADILYQKGMVQEAVEAYLNGIKHAPEDSSIYYALTEMLIDEKRFADAGDALKEIPESEKGLKQTVLLGYCNEGMDRTDEAEQCADAVLSLERKNALALNLKGMLAYKKGQIEEAGRLFAEAVASDLSYGEPYTNLGVLKWSAGIADEALYFSEQGFVLSPTLQDMLSVYHSIASAQGEFERMEWRLREAKSLHPLHRRITYFLIDVLIRQGKNEDAISEIQDAMITFGADDGMLTAALEIRKRIDQKKTEEMNDAKSRQDRPKVSLCMIVKNEEKNLARCLKSAAPLADEIIVADTGSSDRTKDIAEVFGARVYDFEWTGDFSAARNFSLSMATGSRVLILDADEVISSEDHAALRKLVRKKEGKPLAYSFITRNYVKEMTVTGWTENNGRYREEAGTGWFPGDKVRLFPNDKRITFENPVHEFVEPSLKRAGISIKECSVPIHHYGKLGSGKVLAKGADYCLIGKKKLEERADDIQALFELAVQTTELHNYDSAADLWKRVIDFPGKVPDEMLARAYLNLGGAYLELRQYAEAISSSRKAVELAPALKGAVINYGLAELCAGDIGNSVRILEDLLARDDYPPARTLLAAAYYISGKNEKGRDCLQEVKETGFNSAGYLYHYAKNMVAAGRIREGITVLEAAVESGNVNKDILALLADCYRNTIIGQTVQQPA